MDIQKIAESFGGKDNKDVWAFVKHLDKQSTLYGYRQNMVKII